MTDDLFYYKSFYLSEDRQTVYFDFQISRGGEKHDLTETIKFPVALPDNQAISSALRALHLALGISYYKIFVSSEISHPYFMDQTEAEFWNTVFLNGLGEFLYVNKLDRSKLAQFKPQDGQKFDPSTDWQPENKAILGIGGGKDSIVAGELLKNAGMPLEGFVMATGEQLGQTKSVSETMGIKLHVIERSLDKQLLELQERTDAHKGHIPISMIFGLVGSVLAIANKSSYVVVANEASASIPRANWQGQDVNHQWSKSLEFETLLQKYLHTQISPNLTYFSAVRPLSSIAIAKLFANYSQYFEVFTSDNSIFRIDPSKRPNGRWSLESPKSLSSFILLAPWMSESDLLKTFGRNLLDESSLETLLYELIGLEGEQPLDCVGTVEELLLSLNLMYKQGKFTSSVLVQNALEHGAIKQGDWDNQLELSLAPSGEHLIPSSLIDILSRQWQQPEGILKQLAGKDVVFVGVGKGRAIAPVEDFIRDQVEIGSFSGVDKLDTDDPLGFLLDYDQSKTVFIKNEGIPGHEMPVPYLTPMQIFFEIASDKKLTTIGITGTKGKSTTTSLTAHILRTAGKDVVLAGNIGVSPLQALKSATQDTVFVLELSSYQLSDLRISPNISACTNLYNDHTDWHGSLEAYHEAKHNIMKFAGRDDLFVYNPEFEELKQWAIAADCKTVAINVEEDFDLSNSKLFGDHNRLNVLIARQIAVQLGIDDDTIKHAVDSFEPLKHRMQVVATKNNVTYIDDAIGMTPESTMATLKAVKEKYGYISCLMLGGQDRNYDFSELMKLISDINIPNLVLFPDTITKMKQNLPDGYNPEIFEATSMTEAVNFASQKAPSDSVVLLSTAAPSYSLWQDFEDKGNQFQTAVSQL